MDKLKKLTCLLLTLVLCVGLVPSEVFAIELKEGEEQEISENITEEPIGDTEDSEEIQIKTLSDEEVFDLLYSDSEQSKAYFESSADYWNNLPKFEGGTSIKMEDGSEIPIYKTVKDPITENTKTYYLYCIYNVREYTFKKSYTGESDVKAYINQLFYCTLPYSDSQYTGSNVSRFTDDNKPIPISIADTRPLKDYALSEVKNGGTKTITSINGDSRDISFDGMDLWFNDIASIGINYETAWAGKGLNFSYPYPDNRNLKNTMQMLPWSDTSNPTANFRNTKFEDPTAFLQSNIVPRKVYSPFSSEGLLEVGTTTFINDTGNLQTEGLYSSSEMKKCPWNIPGIGELSNGKMVKYKNTINSKWIKSDGTVKDFVFTDGLLKSFEITAQDATALKSVLGDISNNYTITEGTFYYLNEENPDVKELYGLVKTFDYVYGQHDGDTMSYLPTNEKGTLTTDKGWYALMQDNQIGKNNYPLKGTDYKTIPGPNALTGSTMKNLLIQAFSQNHSTNEAIEMAEAYLMASWTGKAFFMLKYIVSDQGMIDPEIEWERGTYMRGASISWGKSGHYNDSVLPRVLADIGEVLLPLSTEKDLVLSDTEKNPVSDEEYYGTNIWKLKENLTPTELKPLGISKVEDFNKNATNSKGEKSTPSGLYDLNKEEFLNLFEKVDLKDGVLPDETYVIQSSVYMKANAFLDELDKKVDINTLALYSYHSDIQLGWNVGGYKASGLPNETKTPIKDWKGTANVFYKMPISASDTNAEHITNAYQNEMKILGQLQDSEFSKKILIGNPLTPYLYKEKNNQEYSWYPPYAGYSQPDAGVVEGYGNDGWKNSSTIPNSDEENKFINYKTYRTLLHVPKMDELARYSITPNSEDAYMAINIFLNDGTGHGSIQFSKNDKTGLDKNLIETVSNIYYFERDALINTLKFLKEYEPTAKSLDEKFKIFGASAKTEQDRKNLIAEVHSYLPNELLVKALKTKTDNAGSYKFLFDENGNVNINDNIDNNNDAITLYAKIKVNDDTPEQYNLGITYISIYGKSREGSGDWQEIYRSDSGEVEEIVKNKKGIVDLTAMGIVLNTNMDYVVCFAQGFASFNEEFKENPDVDANKDPNSLYMYGYVEGLANATESKVYPDYSFYGNTLPNKYSPPKWTDKNAGLTPHWGEMRSASGMPSDATVKNWTPAQAKNNTDHQNQILSGVYYDGLISQGQGKTDAEGNQYIDGVYSLGVHDDWSSYPEDQDARNPNTVLPLPVDMIDPEDLKIKYRFTNATDFDNAITDVYLIDRDGNRVDLSQDCYDPAWLKDVDLGSSDPYYGNSSNPSQMGYTLVVKVERLETGKEHKDVGSQSQLSFYGSMFGNDYVQSSPLILNYASSTGQVRNLKEQVTNSGGTLSKNGDYITYYLNNVYPTNGIDICGTFVFKHRDKNNQLSVADKNMLNNYKKGAASWGPLDFIVSNLKINPEKLYIPQDESYYPSWNSGEFYVNFSCDVEATYTDKNGNKPIINNDKLWTNFVLTLDAKNMNVAGTEFSQQYEVFRINNMKMTINGGSIHLSGQAKINQRMEGMQSNIVNNGSMITYRKDVQYRFTARINGGNSVYEGSSTHEKPNDQKVKLETIHNNNRDYAYLDTKSPPPEDCPWCEYWCETPHTMNTWTVTFHWTKCPGELWDSHTVCSGDPSSCTTYTDCHPQGCFSWTGQKTFKETFKIEAYVKSQANGNQWVQISGSSPIEIRAGQTFQFRAKTIYETDRWDMPPEHPWGGCSYCHRSPGYSRPSATRQVRVRVRNPSGGQEWTYTTYMSGWDQNHDSPVFTVPEDTQNLTMTYDIDVRPFWGYREQGIDEQLCDRKLGIQVKITNPLPVASGTQIVD